MKARKIANTRQMQAKRRASVFRWIDWSVDPEGHTLFHLPYATPETTLAQPLPRPTRFGEEDEVDVYVELTYPLTEGVPEEERSANFTAKSLLDVCLKVRSMYAHLYAEDRKRGGKTADETKAEDPEWRLMNRKTGPWIWGHDMSDLIVEGIALEWKTPTHCHATLFMGS